MSLECYLWSCWALVGTHCRVILTKVNDLSFCLSGQHSLTFELATSLTSVVGEMVTTTFTLRQTRVTPEFSVCWSMQACLSSSEEKKAALIFFFMALNAGRTSVPVIPRKRPQNVQAIKFYFFFFSSSIYTQPRSTSTTEQKLL